MLEHKKIHRLDDFFVELDQRKERGVYFYRINGYTDEIDAWIKKYYDAARQTGIVIQGKLPNPSQSHLTYYNEVMGADFRKDRAFLSASLKKWLPRMNDNQRDCVTEAMYRSLDGMQKEGKTENMLKNAYIKFMCWLYYKLEQVVSRLGENHVPKLLYEGEIGHYELMLLSILSSAGCDVVLLQYHGDREYLKLDPNSRWSDALQIEGMKPFPVGYSLQSVKVSLQNALAHERLYQTRPSIHPCTNAWITGKGLEDIKKRIAERGSDPQFFYNCFYRIHGVQDRSTYGNELLALAQEIEQADRKLVIVSGQMQPPTAQEIAAISRKNDINYEQMIADLSANIQYGSNIELQRIMHQAFVDLMLSEIPKEGMTLRKLTNRAVYLLCWLKRYTPLLFPNWRMPEVGCFIYLGGCKNEKEAMWMRFLARLPVDVVVLCPNRNTRCCLQDTLLYEIGYTESLDIDKFPDDTSQIKMGTVAYHAERDLDTLMYQDTGMYRNQQYTKAKVINLETMYEEIAILWDQELPYRPNFRVAQDVVNIPVIFAKVSGVKDGRVSEYWTSIKALITKDTMVVKGAPYIERAAENPVKPYAAEFFRNGRLQKDKIKNHPQYRYALLREEMQDFMLDKLEDVIKHKLIKGIGENGTEYTVIATVLNLPNDIIRLVQRFDFTKKNPKLIYINTGETMISLEDAIIVAFLNLMGFDIVFFVPTGYQSIEKFFREQWLQEHQIGEYKYDLRVPDWLMLGSHKAKSSWREKLFGGRT